MTTQTDNDAVRRVLNLARWAPSGDNTQPWRFEIAGDRHVLVQGFDLPTPCVYDLDYFAPHLTVGALLETMDLAASTEGWSADVRRRADSPASRPCFDVRFEPRMEPPHPLAKEIGRRAVQRSPMSTKPLTAEQKRTLEESVGPGYRIVWLERFGQRLQAALLVFHYAHLRLTMPEAYPVHRAVIEWDASDSVDRIPDRALGVSAPTLKLMRFVMQSWKRVQFFNRFLAGTWMPRLQMELLPGLACAAQLVLLRDVPARTIDEQVEAGRVIQRLWLTATEMGLWKQPQATPVVFSRYSKAGLGFTSETGKLRQNDGLRHRFERLIKADSSTAIWMARIGTGPAPVARAIRQPLEKLWIPRA